MTTNCASKALATAAVALVAATAAACGSGGSGGSGGSQSTKVAFLMPDQASTRYELHDRPGFEAKLKELCPRCTPIYNNADADADKQQQQFNSALAQGAKVDRHRPGRLGRGRRRGQRRPRPRASRSSPTTGRSRKAKVDFYVSFDNEKIGKLIATSLVDKVKSKPVPPDGRPPAGQRVADRRGGGPDQEGHPRGRRHQRRPGAGRVRHDRLEAGERAEVGRRPDLPLRQQDRRAWSPPTTARRGGAIAAFKAAGGIRSRRSAATTRRSPALQLIIAGDQYNTINKPSEIVGGAAAEAADTLLKGEAREPTTSSSARRRKLFDPDAGHPEEPQGRDHRQEHQHRRRPVHRAYAAAARRWGISVTARGGSTGRRGRTALDDHAPPHRHRPRPQPARCQQGLRRGQRADRHRPRRRRRRGRRHRRRQRRRQVDAREGARRRPPADTGTISFSGKEVRSPTRVRRSTWASPRCSRTSRCARTSTWSRTSSSAARWDRGGSTRSPWRSGRGSCCSSCRRKIPTRPRSRSPRSPAASGRPWRSPARCCGDPSIIILDEPTAALGVAQTAEVLDMIERLRERGLGVIMISHNMEDVRAVADRIVVLRLGRNNGEFDARDRLHRGLVAAITGATDNVVTRRAGRQQRPTATPPPADRRTSRMSAPTACDVARPERRAARQQRRRARGAGVLLAQRARRRRWARCRSSSAW